MNDFRMGQHEEAIRRLQTDVTEVRADVKQVLRILDERKGERKANAKISAGFGLIGGSTATLMVKVLLMKLGLHG